MIDNRELPATAQPRPEDRPIIHTALVPTSEWGTLGRAFVTVLTTVLVAMACIVWLGAYGIEWPPLTHALIGIGAAVIAMALWRVR